MGSRGMSKGHRVGLLSLLMIHKAYLPVYIQIFLVRFSTKNPREPKNSRNLCTVTV